MKKTWGRLDVLITNAAVSTHFGDQFLITEKQMDKMGQEDKTTKIDILEKVRKK